jgi:hypothetical protein
MKKKTTRKTYKELIQLNTFEERYKFLQLRGIVGSSTFGYERFLNQGLYTSRKWRNTRDEVIIRDDGCDLGVAGYQIYDKIIIHHINPLTPEEIEFEDDSLYDLDNLISTSFKTHNAIHYGDINLLDKQIIERRPKDTCPWLV